MDWTNVVSSFLGAALGVVVSLASERVRARIGGQFWLAQERWKLKADIYSSLLKLLNREIEANQRVAELLFQGTDPEAPEEAPLPEHIDRQITAVLVNEIAPAAKELRELGRVAALWLSESSVVALREATASVSAPYFLNQCRRHAKALERAVEVILAEAQKDLRLEVRGT